MDINEHLANNVMGMYIDPKQPYPYDNWWFSNDGLQYCHVDDWNPRENIEQAYMCALLLSKTMTINMVLDGLEPYVVIPEKRIWEESDSLTNSLSLAMAKATGYLEPEE